MCSATTDWFVGMAEGDGAALYPVPSGLSTKRSPKRRFHAKGLGDRGAELLLRPAAKV